MMARAPAARCELRGGARQPSGFNNSLRDALRRALSEFPAAAIVDSLARPRERHLLPLLPATISF